MTTLEAFALKLNAAAHELPDVGRRCANVAGLEVKNTVLAEFRSVAPNLRLRGVGKRGAKIGVRYDAGISTTAVVVRATGPVHLIESDTKAHKIPKQRSRGRRRVVVIPGVGVRASVNHPGTHGQHPWRKGVAIGTQRVPAVMQAEVSKSLRKVFGGI